MISLKDKIVFVSGASAGIGESMARAFAAHGSRILMCTRAARLLAVLGVGALSIAGMIGGQSPPPKPDLTVKLESTALLRPNQLITITVTVMNNGGPAPASGCVIFVRNVHPPRQTLRTIKKTVRALDSGDHFTFSFTIKLGLGLFEVTAVTDPKNKIAELDETNNEARIRIKGI
jgi:NAD(P)-dependent dehydrogenase (short-subunit alcohol dehydrogenase family)